MNAPATHESLQARQALSSQIQRLVSEKQTLLTRLQQLSTSHQRLSQELTVAQAAVAQQEKHLDRHASLAQQFEAQTGQLETLRNRLKSSNQPRPAPALTSPSGAAKAEPFPALLKALDARAAALTTRIK